MPDFVIYRFHDRIHCAIDHAAKSRDTSSYKAWSEIRRIPIPNEFKSITLDQMIRAYGAACVLADNRPETKTAKGFHRGRAVELIVCPSCHGRGGDGAAAMICVTCGGKRTIERVVL